MKEVKCQILSQISFLALHKCFHALIITFACCLYVVAPSFAQADTANNNPLPNADLELVNENSHPPQSTSNFSANENATQTDSVASNDTENGDIVVEQDLEDLKKTALELNRDLLILEEELLFPSNTQIVIFLSTDVGKFFTIDSVKLKINDTLVASHLYTPYQSDALVRGGVQRLYIGNLKQGQHEITAVYTGEGPNERKYKRAATLNIEKDDDPIMLELLVQDETTNMQPAFTIKEWEL